MMQSLGASGAIFGLLGAEAVLLMHVSLRAFLESIGRTAFFAIIVAVLVPNIDHMGHLGVSYVVSLVVLRVYIRTSEAPFFVLQTFLKVWPVSSSCLRQEHNK